MKTLVMILLLGCAIPLGADQQRSCPVDIRVGEDKSLLVRFSCMEKGQLAEIVSVVFSRGDEKAKANFEQILGESPDLTLELTTKRREK